MDLSFLSAPLLFTVRYDDKLMIRWSLIKIMLTLVSSRGFAIRTISLARFITPATPSRARGQGKSIHCIHRTEHYTSVNCIETWTDGVQTRAWYGAPEQLKLSLNSTHFVQNFKRLLSNQLVDDFVNASKMSIVIRSMFKLSVVIS